MSYRQTATTRRSIAFELARQANISVRRKNSIEASSEAGHDFNPAAKSPKMKPGFSPCHSLTTYCVPGIQRFFLSSAIALRPSAKQVV